MFDPVWILLDTKTKSKWTKLSDFDSFFKTTDESVNPFFDNQIFAYHWHSRNNFKVEPDSFYSRIERKHSNILKNRNSR